MRSQPTTAVWMATAFCAALGLAAAVLGTSGADSASTVKALSVTARLSFLLFWPAYAGSAMAAIFGPAFQPLKRHARDFGLAFASAHLVHIGLVCWLCLIGAAPSASTFAFFGVALLCTYLLALFSFRRLHQALNPKYWRLMSTVGLNYIMFAFAVDFMKHPLSGSARHILEYLPFIILAIAGPVLRLAAFTLRIGRVWTSGELARVRPP